jgi:hypothetical protein
LPAGTPQNNQTMRPQLPVQPNPNPNNKVVQYIDIYNQPTLSLLPAQCNDIHIRSGRIVEPTIADVTSPDKEATEEHDAPEKVQSSSNNAAETTPFPERLALTKTPEPPAFNILGELHNLYVKIPLLQALRDKPICARTMRDICVKKPGRKTKDPLTVHVMGDLSALMSGKTPPVKYGDPGHPTITVQVGKTIIPRVLVDLGATINIGVTEKEFLAVIYAINIFRHYITGYSTFIHTDHSTIKYLMNKPITNARVTRWLLLLQEFDITIVDRPGKENVVADFLSRLTLNDDNPVDDSFPDEYLFAVSAHSPWYADIANYLVAGKLPSHLSYREKKSIVHQSARYSWISGYLFHTGADQEIRRCVREDEVYDILKACHDDPCGGNFADKRTAYKILRMGYYWP